MPCPPKAIILIYVCGHGVPCPYKPKQKKKMKKTYVAPIVEEIKVNVVSMMATSLGISETTVNTEDEQLGREEKGISSPSVWGNEW